MSAYIVDNQSLADRVEALSNAQPVRASRSAMIEAVMDEACRRFEATGDPEAWRSSRSQSSESGTSDSTTASRQSVGPQHMNGSNAETDTTSAANGAGDKRESA
jgi:hypothetical protein